MTRTILPPYLTSIGGVKRCSACHHPFDSSKLTSLGAAFRKHVEEVHRSSHKYEDAKLTAPGIVVKKTK